MQGCNLLTCASLGPRISTASALSSLACPLPGLSASTPRTLTEHPTVTLHKQRGNYQIELSHNEAPPRARPAAHAARPDYTLGRSPRLTLPQVLS